MVRLDDVAGPGQAARFHARPDHQRARGGVTAAGGIRLRSAAGADRPDPGGAARWRPPAGAVATGWGGRPPLDHRSAGPAGTWRPARLQRRTGASGAARRIDTGGGSTPLVRGCRRRSECSAAGAPPAPGVRIVRPRRTRPCRNVSRRVGIWWWSAEPPTSTTCWRGTASCRCRPTSGAPTVRCRSTPSAIRRSSRARPAPSPRRPRVSTSVRRCSTRWRRVASRSVRHPRCRAGDVSATARGRPHQPRR